VRKVLEDRASGDIDRQTKFEAKLEEEREKHSSAEAEIEAVRFI